MKTTIMKIAKSKIKFVIALGFLVFAISCDKDDPVAMDDPIPPIAELAAEVIDCSTSVVSGETLTLEDRKDGVDYIIDCVYSVSGDLIIKPGVTIQFGTDAGLNVSATGSLQVLGLENDQIVFTGEDKAPGAWKGIIFFSNDTKNTIEHAKIEYAGGDGFNSNDDRGGVIAYSGTRLNMNNTTILNSATYGFNASYGDCELVLENNTITNSDVPMLVLPNYVDAIFGGDYTGNATDAIYVANGSVNIDATYRELGVPYHILARLVVSAGGGKLTINPGVALEFGLSGSLEINEGASGSKPSLVAVGTPQNPILFTAIDKVEGAWNGIYFDSPSALNEIGFATIEYASNADQEGSIQTWYYTVLNVHDVTFKDIVNFAIHEYRFTNDPSTLTLSNLDYVNVGGEYLNN